MWQSTWCSTWSALSPCRQHRWAFHRHCSCSTSDGLFRDTASSSRWIQVTLPAPTCGSIRRRCSSHFQYKFDKISVTKKCYYFKRKALSLKHFTEPEPAQVVHLFRPIPPQLWQEWMDTVPGTITLMTLFWKRSKEPRGTLIESFRQISLPTALLAPTPVMALGPGATPLSLSAAIIWFCWMYHSRCLISFTSMFQALSGSERLQLSGKVMQASAYGSYVQHSCRFSQKLSREY